MRIRRRHGDDVRFWNARPIAIANGAAVLAAWRRNRQRRIRRSARSANVLRAFLAIDWHIRIVDRELYAAYAVAAFLSAVVRNLILYRSACIGKDIPAHARITRAHRTFRVRARAIDTRQALDATARIAKRSAAL